MSGPVDELFGEHKPTASRDPVRPLQILLVAATIGDFLGLLGTWWLGINHTTTGELSSVGLLGLVAVPSAGVGLWVWQRAGEEHAIATTTENSRDRQRAGLVRHLSFYVLLLTALALATETAIVGRIIADLAPAAG